MQKEDRGIGDQQELDGRRHATTAKGKTAALIEHAI